MTNRYHFWTGTIDPATDIRNPNAVTVSADLTDQQVPVLARILAYGSAQLQRESGFTSEVVYVEVTDDAGTYIGTHDATEWDPDLGRLN